MVHLFFQCQRRYTRDPKCRWYHKFWRCMLCRWVSWWGWFYVLCMLISLCWGQIVVKLDNLSQRSIHLSIMLHISLVLSSRHYWLVYGCKYWLSLLVQLYFAPCTYLDQDYHFWRNHLWHKECKSLLWEFKSSYQIVLMRTVCKVRPGHKGRYKCLMCTLYHWTITMLSVCRLTFRFWYQTCSIDNLTWVSQKSTIDCSAIYHICILVRVCTMIYNVKSICSLVYSGNLYSIGQMIYLRQHYPQLRLCNIVFQTSWMALLCQWLNYMVISLKQHKNHSNFCMLIKQNTKNKIMTFPFQSHIFCRWLHSRYALDIF